MPYAGKQLMPREIAQLGWPHWSGHEIVKMVATTLGESSGSIGAWHDNLDSNLVLISRDCGLMQINVNVHQIDEGVAATLMTDSKESKVYDPIVKNNVLHGYKLYEEPGSNNGLRRWQPWVAYTTGWATFPEWWVWHQDADHNPIGPWIATGRYIQKAIVGVANFRLVIAKTLNEEQALALAVKEANHFGVKGTLGIRKGIVGWTTVPARPKVAPADGIGTRPVPNSGA